MHTYTRARFVRWVVEVLQTGVKTICFFILLSLCCSFIVTFLLENLITPMIRTLVI